VRVGGVGRGRPPMRAKIPRAPKGNVSVRWGANHGPLKKGWGCAVGRGCGSGGVKGASR